MSCLKGQAGTVHELMEAALVEQERGRAGLLNWFEQGRPLDPLATRLLPFLYERYREHDLPVALRERLGGAYPPALLQGLGLVGGAGGASGAEAGGTGAYRAGVGREQRLSAAAAQSRHD